MAQSTSNNSRKTWKGVLIGAAVPIAMLAGAPAASAEQLPAAPDVQALLDLQLCLADLQAALSVDVPAEVPGAEQLPAPGDLPGLPTDAPDVAAMNETCQTVLALVLAQSPDVPVDPPVDVPGPVPPAG
ncbi:hypothetical protein [Glycomyces paridis]|uniref:Secreted protein n=1 Tax=Glycomyces paridis TaxID=2126555 RepID=A0A4S8PL57_9ACTN|nr:hypothetical protein [Glycomyces paridis]THV31503.1 hypothetical protein E9998_03840 [Glycomyces paridis]